MKFLPTITTAGSSNWKDKIREINDMKLEEVALFLTGMTKDQRKFLYDLIKTSSIKRIPMVHLKDDMTIDELEFLAKEYDTRVFNTHSEKEYAIDNKWLVKYRELICIENTHNSPLDEMEIKNYGGICLDFAHLENTRLLEMDRYAKEVAILSKFPVKCNHISAIKKDFSFIDDKNRKLRYDSHHLDDMKELDYLKNYPIQYFSDFCAIELDNKLVEQLEAIDYIQKFMGERNKLINRMIQG